MSLQHTGQVAYLLGQHQRLLNGSCACGQRLPDGQQHRLHVAEALVASGLAQDPSEVVAAFLGAARGSLDAERVAPTTVERVMRRLVTGSPDPDPQERIGRPVGRCVGCFHDFAHGSCGGCGAVKGADEPNRADGR